MTTITKYKLLIIKESGARHNLSNQKIMTFGFTIVPSQGANDYTVPL